MNSPEDPPRPPPPPPPTERLPGPVPPRQPRVAPVAPVAPPVVERIPPALPEEARWWESPWPAILIGLLALVIGGIVGYAIGHNGKPAGREAAITQTVTNTSTIARPPVVRTDTVTASTVTQTPSPANQANEERRTEAETNLRKAERENEELKKRLEEAGGHP